MAKRQIIETVCDVTGTVLTEETRTVRKLAVGRRTFQLDLTPEEAERFDAALTEWTAVATPVRKKRKKRRAER